MHYQSYLSKTKTEIHCTGQIITLSPGHHITEFSGSEHMHQAATYHLYMPIIFIYLKLLWNNDASPSQIQMGAWLLAED